MRAKDIAELAAHPQFPKAIRTLGAGMVEFFAGNRLINLVVSDRARAVMAVMAIYLDAHYEPRDPLSGLTLNRFKARCAETGLCSPGRAVAMLGLMRFAGYIAPVARADRGLPSRLIPTQKLIGSQHERWRRVFRALALVRSEGEAGLALMDNPGFTKPFVRAIGDLFLSRERLIEHGPDLALFLDRKGGMMILMSLMLSAENEEGLPPHGPMSVPVAQLARQFATSRAHVKGLLRSAVAEGLFEAVDADQAAFRVTSKLRASILGFSAALLLLVAEGVAAAEQRMQRDAGPLEGAA